MTDELMAELLAHVSIVEVEERGVSTDAHSGGLVVLRWNPGRPGLVNGACSGGLE